MWWVRPEVGRGHFLLHTWKPRLGVGKARRAGGMCPCPWAHTIAVSVQSVTAAPGPSESGRVFGGVCGHCQMSSSLHVEEAWVEFQRGDCIPYTEKTGKKDLLEIKVHQ